MTMGKRARKGGDEMDVFSRWRYLLGLDRHSYAARVKRRARRRERRQARQGFGTLTDD